MDRQTMLKRFTVFEMQKMLTFLDEVREIGSINMFGAGPLLCREFFLGRGESHAVLAHWMETFASRHPRVGPTEVK